MTESNIVKVGNKFKSLGFNHLDSGCTETFEGKDVYLADNCWINEIQTMIPIPDSDESLNKVSFSVYHLYEDDWGNKFYQGCDFSGTLAEVIAYLK